MLVDDIFGSYILDSRPASEFYYDSAKNKLINLDLNVDEAINMVFTTPGIEMTEDRYADQGGTGRQGKVLRLGGRVDLESKLTVRVQDELRATANHH
jgi:DNA mismatch repair protein MSH5